MLESQKDYWFGKELKAYAMETLMVTAGAAVAFTAATLAVAGKEKAVRAFISVENNAIRYTVHGTNPSAASGHPVLSEGNGEVEGKTNLERFRMIGIIATAIVTVTYARYED